MNNYFVILAAGKSERFHNKIAKQFYYYKNKEVIDHSIEKSLNSNLFKMILIVTNNLNRLTKKRYPKSVKIIKGGKDRSDSSLIALKYLKKFKPTNVLIHDAARPNCSMNLIHKIIKKSKNSSVIPRMPIQDALKENFDNKNILSLNRKDFFITQTLSLIHI